MINHIDVGGALRRSVCHLYSDLVTRPTGAAVRREIEHQLAAAGDRTLTVIDFSQVGLLDFSCADEVVAKLLLRYTPAPAHDAGDAPEASDAADAGATVELAPVPLPRERMTEGYFLFRGVREVHLDAIEAVLERHGLALVIEAEPGLAELLGTVDAAERAAWRVVEAAGRCTGAELAAALDREPAEASALLDTLCQRRLAMRVGDGYVAVGATLLSARPQ